MNCKYKWDVIFFASQISIGLFFSIESMYIDDIYAHPLQAEL